MEPEERRELYDHFHANLAEVCSVLETIIRERTRHHTDTAMPELHLKNLTECRDEVGAALDRWPEPAACGEIDACGGYLLSIGKNLDTSAYPPGESQPLTLAVRKVATTAFRVWDTAEPAAAGQ